MGTIGVDSVVVFLDDFEVRADNRLSVQPAKFMAQTGEAVGEYYLFRQEGNPVHGNRAYYNGEDFNVSILPLGDSVKCKVQCSLPKVMQGNNYDLLNIGDTRQAVVKLQNIFGECGMKGNLHTAKISRLDITRNIHTEDSVQSYFSVLGHLEGKRQKRMDYGTTFLWGNHTQQVCAYDKLEEEKHHKVDITGKPQTLRIEHRLLNTKKVQSATGLVHLQDVYSADGFQRMQEEYVRTLAGGIFRYNPDVVQMFGQRDLEKQLLVMKSIYGNKFRQEYERQRGQVEIYKMYEMDVYIDAVLNVSGVVGNSRKVRRSTLKKNLLQEKLRAVEVGQQEELFKKRKFGDLYAELKRKTLSRVA